MQTAYFGRMRSVVEHHGGTVEKFIGDAVVAVFGAVRLHEDDAERAARCALGMREALAGLNDSSGPGSDSSSRYGSEWRAETAFVSGGPDALATGDVMNTAARLEQAAEEGEILAERATMLLTRAAVEFAPPRRVQAKGEAEPVEVWPVTGIAARARRRRLNLVGRERELEQLAAALESAIRGREARVAVVLGEPGIGKSRLADEFAARTLGRASGLPNLLSCVWRGSSVGSVGGGRATGDRHRRDRPAGCCLREVARALASPTRGGRGLVGRGSAWSGRRRHACPSFLRPRAGLGSSMLLEGLAAREPAVVVFDDLHWASET